jgi:hypothetical protein
LIHVWTTAVTQGNNVSIGKLVRCSHVSGLKSMRCA